jgi:TctA family transporter
MNTIHTKTIVVVVGVLLGIVVGEKSVLSTEVGIIALMLAMVQSGLYFFSAHHTTILFRTIYRNSTCTVSGREE